MLVYKSKFYIVKVIIKYKLKKIKKNIINKLNMINIYKISIIKKIS